MYDLPTRFDAIMFVPLALAISGVFAGCSSPGKSAEGPSATGSSSAAEQCDYVNYHHDEAKNDGGAGHCATDCDCDGMRSCTSGTCQGTARPATGSVVMSFGWAGSTSTLRRSCAM